MNTIKKYPKLGEEIHSARLPNGLTVFVVPKRGFHKSYAYFAADYGGADRRFKISGKWLDTPAGVAHFLEHKMFDTENGNALELLSANGASPNAYTSTEITAYHFECIDKFTENLETLLRFVSVPYFTPESVAKEQGIIVQEIRMMEDDPDFCLYYGFLRSLYASNPIRDPVAGTVESIAEITADTLYDCHKVFYNPSNMALCVVGDTEPSMIYEIAQKVLPSEPGEVPERDYGTPETVQPENKHVKKAMDISLPVFLAGCKTLPAARGDGTLWLELVSVLALEVLAGHSSPFYMRLYDEGQINADFSASFDTAAGAAYSMFGGEARDPQRVFDEVINEIRRLKKHGPDAALFERIKKASIGSCVRALNSFGAIASNVIEGHFRGYDAFSAPDILSKVTVDDITRFICDNLTPENMTISVITPK